MNTIDIVIVVLFLVSLAIGYWKGFIRSIMTWAGLALAFFLFAYFGPMVRAGISIHLNLSSSLSGILAYLLILVLVFIIIRILSILFEQIAHLLALSFVNRILGAVFSFINCMICLMFLMFIVDALPFLHSTRDTLIESSTLLNDILRLANKVILDYRDKLPPELFETLGK